MDKKQRALENIENMPATTSLPAIPSSTLPSQISGVVAQNIDKITDSIEAPRLKVVIIDENEWVKSSPDYAKLPDINDIYVRISNQEGPYLMIIRSIYTPRNGTHNLKTAERDAALAYMKQNAAIIYEGESADKHRDLKDGDKIENPLLTRFSDS